MTQDIPSTKILTETIAACVANGNRLLDESYDLEFREPPSLQFYVLLIAQEEFAKAFILLLVRDGIVPFSRPLLRAMNDHACKNLVGLIMDYIAMSWETLEECEALVRADFALGNRLPAVIESAIVLLRFEKIGRWGPARGPGMTRLSMMEMPSVSLKAMPTVENKTLFMCGSAETVGSADRNRSRGT